LGLGLGLGAGLGVGLGVGLGAGLGLGGALPHVVSSSAIFLQYVLKTEMTIALTRLAKGLPWVSSQVSKCVERHHTPRQARYTVVPTLLTANCLLTCRRCCSTPSARGAR
jgi:hypothetical protein